MECTRKIKTQHGNEIRRKHRSNNIAAKTPQKPKISKGKLVRFELWVLAFDKLMLPAYPEQRESDYEIDPNSSEKSKYVKFTKTIDPPVPLVTKISIG